LEIYYKEILIKSSWPRHKSKYWQMEPSRQPSKNLHTSMNNWLLTKVQKTHNRQRTVSSINNVWKLNIHKLKSEIRPLSHIHIKNQFKMK
jgi:hypothetical protein